MTAPVIGCDQCRRPGRACGGCTLGDCVPDALPCVCCGEPTCVRSACGAPRTHLCGGPRPRDTEPAPRPRAAATTRVAAPRPPRGRKADQAAATEAACGLVDSGGELRFLTDLEGVFAPLRAVEGRTGRSQPWWRPPLPGVTWAVDVIGGYGWRRPWQGEVAVLDRSGAWVAAASSVVVAHGALSHVGETVWEGRPGYYQVTAHPWYETAMPYPLGHVKVGSRPWLPAPHIALLADLVHQGRWPDVDIWDAYTGDGCRLTDWAAHLNTVRVHAITHYGRSSDQYDRVKGAIGEATSLMLGRLEGTRRVWSCKSARPDIRHHIESQGSAILWRWADDCRAVAGPELAPVALRNVDELVVPAAALDLLVSRERPGGRPPMLIDPSGCRLGSFKIKEMEVWAA